MSGSENNNADDKTSNYGSGYLEISEKGFGFLRTAANHFHPKPTDIFVTPDTIRRSFLREGSHVAGATQPPHRGTSPQLKAVEKVNDMPFEEYTKAVRFENLTTIDPIEKFNLETTPDLLETRIIDLVTPIGKGTRGLIVSPPRSGKTTILKQICNAITTNHPDVYVMVLLIDERPEEVTDFQRSVKAEVVASSNDQDLETHVRLSRFMIERCRRMVEAGKESFRPVVMITLAAIIGMAPLAFSKEIGSEFRNDIGIALIGGILVSGILSQLVIPILYNLFAKTDKPEEAEIFTDGLSDNKE